MRRGFTLVEIVLATSLILLTLLAVARMAPTAHRGVNADKDHLIALAIARSTLERVRSLPWGTDPTFLKGPVPWTDESVEGRDVSLDFAVQDVLVKVPAGTAGFGTVTVIVAWHQGIGKADSAGNNSLQMTGGLNREP